VSPEVARIRFLVKKPAMDAGVDEGDVLV